MSSFSIYKDKGLHFRREIGTGDISSNIYIHTTDLSKVFYPVIVDGNGYKPLFIDNSATPLSYIPFQSKLGIGTSIPQYNLDVNDTLRTYFIIDISNVSGNVGQVLARTVGGIKWTDPSGTGASATLPTATVWGEYLFYNDLLGLWRPRGIDNVAIGSNAGKNNANSFSIAIGMEAGRYTLGGNAIAIGTQAGLTNEQTGAISIGYQAGTSGQGTNSIAIGIQAGLRNQNSNSIAIGFQAGYIDQSRNTIAIGCNAGCNIQGPNAISIGGFAGESRQSSNAIAIGIVAGRSNQGTQAIAIGPSAGCNIQGQDAIAIGSSAGCNSQGIGSIAIGCNAGRSNQGTYAISIGSFAGQTNQHSNTIIINATGTDISSYQTNSLYIAPIRNGGANNVLYYNSDTKEILYDLSNSIAGGPGVGTLPRATQWSEYLFWSDLSNAWRVGGGIIDLSRVHIGADAGKNNQGTFSIAIGVQSGQNNQGTSSIAIGIQSGQSFQGRSAIAIGLNAGKGTQGSNAIAIGTNAGLSNEDVNSIAIGNAAGTSNLGSGSIAIGYQAGQNFQSSFSIANINSISIGVNTGFCNQGTQAIAIGTGAALSNQGSNSIGIGYQAGYNSQGVSSIAIGEFTGQSNQNPNAIAIGSSSGQYAQSIYGVSLGYFAAQASQNNSAVSIGNCAGQTGQGTNAIAIGKFAGRTNQHSNSIIINANGNNLNSDGANRLYISPIRDNCNNKVLLYNPSTYEITTFDVSNIGTPGFGTNYWTLNSSGDIYNNNNNNNGNVAIKRTTAAYSLDVNGDVRISTNIIDSTNSSGTTGQVLTRSLGGIKWADISSTAINISGGVVIPIASQWSEYLYWNDITNSWRVAGGIQDASRIHIGADAGKINQGTFSIAIGVNAGRSNQHANTTIINATGRDISSSGTNRLFIAPIRDNCNNKVLLYNPNTFEITTFDVSNIGTPGFGTNYWTLNGSDIYNNNNGNVAIKRTTAAYSLDVSGDTRISRNIIDSVNSSGNLNQVLTRSSTGIRWQDISAIGINISGGIIIPGATQWSEYLYWNDVTNAWAVGGGSGKTPEDNFRVHLGAYAGQTPESVSFGGSSVAIGAYSAFTGQFNQSVAIGYEAAYDDQSAYNVAIGSGAGYRSQGNLTVGGNEGRCVAIGYDCAYNYQNQNAIAIGAEAAYGDPADFNKGQDDGCIAIGYRAGYKIQEREAIAIGYQSGRTQGGYSVAIGSLAGENQGSNCIALGVGAGYNSLSSPGPQNDNSIAIGDSAGAYGIGSNSIAIGTAAGLGGIGNYSVVIDAADSTNRLTSFIQPSSFYINPVNTAQLGGTYYTLMRDSTGQVYQSVLPNAFNKTFVIQHPTDNNRYLVHACLEGPEAGVYYRGTGEITNNKSVIISIPDYADKIASNFTINITPTVDFNDDEVNERIYTASNVKNNQFKVFGKNGKFNWIAYGERSSIVVEPSKDDYILSGDGPYTYLQPK
jgi:hypothetical protein